jgi:hypothetical protein
MTLIRSLAVVALAAAVLAGCTDAAKPTTPSSSGATSGAPSSSAPANGEVEGTDEPAIAMNTKRKFHELDAPAELVLADIRIAGHPTYERIVLEFAGTGKPGWSAQYVDPPRADGSGKRIRIEGDSFLDVYASGTVYAEDYPYDGPRLLQPSTEVIRAARVVGSFEGMDQFVIGIDGPRAPYRVFALSDPPRLVVDVAR